VGASRILTCQGNDEGNGGGSQQNLDQDIFELFDDTFPKRFLYLGVQLVCSMLFESLFNFRFRKTRLEVGLKVDSGVGDDHFVDDELGGVNILKEVLLDSFLLLLSLELVITHSFGLEIFRWGMECQVFN